MPENMTVVGLKTGQCRDVSESDPKNFSQHRDIETSRRYRGVNIQRCDILEGIFFLFR